MFTQKSIFVDIFFSFNPNRVMGINGGDFPAICWVCLKVCIYFQPQDSRDKGTAA